MSQQSERLLVNEDAARYVTFKTGMAPPPQTDGALWSAAVRGAIATAVEHAKVPQKDPGDYTVQELQRIRVALGSERVFEWQDRVAYEEKIDAIQF